MKQFLFLLILAGVTCTGLSALVTYQYCIAGSGRGVPCAMTHPGHGPEPLEFVYKGSAIEGRVFDLGSLGLNLGFWSVVVGLPIAVVDSRRRRHKANEMETENHN
jgi:hypothetical protein